MYKSKHTGETIDNSIDLMQYVSNPNLLDNWYFLNPVNQRGQTEYVGKDYHVDRWRGAYTSDVAIITERGLTFKNMRSSGNTFLRQYFENPLEDGVYTLSVLMADAVDATVYLYTTNGQLVGQQVSLTGGMNTVTVEVSGDSVNRVQFTLRDGGLITIVAIKLELGSQQTLAHQDEDGNWVLNEIPNYAEELAKCQRYQLKLIYGTSQNYAPIGFGFANNTTSIRILIPTPATMRAAPTLSYLSGSISGLTILCDGKQLIPESVNTVNVLPYGVSLMFTVSDATSSAPCVLRTTSAYCILDANL